MRKEEMLREYFMETYLPIVMKGEDFKDFKSPMEIYHYIKHYVNQISADDDMINEKYTSSDLAFDLAHEIFNKKNTLKGCYRRAPRRKFLKQNFREYENSVRRMF